MLDDDTNSSAHHTEEDIERIKTPDRAFLRSASAVETADEVDQVSELAERSSQVDS